MTSQFMVAMEGLLNLLNCMSTCLLLSRGLRSDHFTDNGSNNGQHYGRGKNLGVRHYRSSKVGFKPYQPNVSEDYFDIAKKLPNSLDSYEAGSNTEIAFVLLS